MKKALRKFLHNRNLLIGSVMVLFVVLVALLASFIAPYPYNQPHLKDKLQPPSPDWCLALSSSFSYITTAPWLAIFPGLALVFTVFGFNLLGEGLRDLLDPRMKV